LRYINKLVRKYRAQKIELCRLRLLLIAICIKDIINKFDYVHDKILILGQHLIRKIRESKYCVEITLVLLFCAFKLSICVELIMIGLIVILAK